MTTKPDTDNFQPLVYNNVVEIEVVSTCPPLVEDRLPRRYCRYCQLVFPATRHDIEMDKELVGVEVNYSVSRTWQMLSKCLLLIHSDRASKALNKRLYILKTVFESFFFFVVTFVFIFLFLVNL